MKKAKAVTMTEEQAQESARIPLETFVHGLLLKVAQMNEDGSLPFLQTNMTCGNGNMIFLQIFTARKETIEGGENE